MPRHWPWSGGAVRVNQTRLDAIRYACGRANGQPNNNNNNNKEEQQQGAACGSATAKWQNNQRATRRMEMLHMKDEGWRTPHMCNSLRQRVDVDVDAIVGEQKKDLIDGQMQL